VSKTPNLRQAPTGPTIYAPMKLLPVTSIPLAQDPHRPMRPNTSPMIPADRGNGGPLGPMSNTVNQVRK
jgi:hypothetical protein